VQGVFFRACTQEQARNLGVVGWVANTRHNTVKGVIQGESEALEEMKEWLRKKGSPHSRIERAEFTNERTLEGLEFDAFSTERL
ncbi:Acylphosphatase-2, partial [Auxenochlorella protothecoides]